MLLNQVCFLVTIQIFVCYIFVFLLLSERRGVAQDVTLDIKIGIEAKNYEGVSNIKNILYYYYKLYYNIFLSKHLAAGFIIKTIL